MIRNENIILNNPNRRSEANCVIKFFFSDEIAKTETFAIRFSSPDLAQTFKLGFEEAVGKVTVFEAGKIKEEEESETNKNKEESASKVEPCKVGEESETKVEAKNDGGGGGDTNVAEQMSSLKLDETKGQTEN